MSEKLSSEEAIQVHDYFTMNLEDANIDPAKYEEEFKKALDLNKTWQENLEVMDALIEKIAESENKTVGEAPQIQVSFRRIFKTGFPEYNVGDVVRTLQGDVGKIVEKEEGQKYTLPNFVYTVEKQYGTLILVHTTAIESKSNAKKQFQTPLLMFTDRHKKGDSWMTRNVETGEGKLYNPNGDNQHEKQRT